MDEVRRTSSIDSSYYNDKKKIAKENINNSFNFDEGDEFKKYWENYEGQSETSFSDFSAPTKREVAKSTEKTNQYQGLNLWLYQFKAEDMD